MKNSIKDEVSTLLEGWVRMDSTIQRNEILQLQEAALALRNKRIKGASYSRELSERRVRLLMKIVQLKWAYRKQFGTSI